MQPNNKTNNKTDHLAKQDLSKLDIKTLTPITPEVMSRQATINIGTIGHVAHGKTTVVKSLSGVSTIRFDDELRKNITIKLGYANAKIYKCTNPDCPSPQCYRSYGSTKEDTPLCERPNCGHRMKLIRHVSFVDCPGHDSLMMTMLTGTAVMDGVLLLVAGNESCPQPQTSEHLAAVQFMKLKTIIILQNKVDLVKTKEAAHTNFEQIKAFVKGSPAENAPVIPISAQYGYNIDALCEYICNYIQIPKRDFISPPRMTIVRSFDINQPGTIPEDLRGGVIGGTITQGVLIKGQEIEIRPGHVVIDKNNFVHCHPIKTKVISLKAEENELEYAIPGGLIGVRTKIDPSVCRADKLTGQVAGAVGTLPPVYIELRVKIYLLSRLLGVRTERNCKVNQLQQGEILMCNVGSTQGGCRVIEVGAETVKLSLMKPVCTVTGTESGSKIAVSRKIENRWRLIGWGEIVSGTKLLD